MNSSTTSATMPDMKSYIGTKAVKARPMDRGSYNAYRGWDVPADEDPADEGYLVEYIDGGKANHPAHEGYISWSPKDVFERAYVETGTSGDAGAQHTAVGVPYSYDPAREARLSALHAVVQVHHGKGVSSRYLLQEAMAVAAYIERGTVEPLVDGAPGQMMLTKRD
ncbi:hypothetical protein [Acidiphilium sp.]|uniref:hypothetical protein n=1 Tax=Acidiphilium sp. TaxID=527 RepID=UPI00258A6117|nr:hypothetical protein [Acidiphilium sp.]